MMCRAERQKCAPPGCKGFAVPLATDVWRRVSRLPDVVGRHRALRSGGGVGRI